MALSPEKQNAWDRYRETRADLIADLQLQKLLEEGRPMLGDGFVNALARDVSDRIQQSGQNYKMALRLMENAGE
ncbi:hypothetical protein JKA73_10985 [Myxococcus xanthus]|uniref:hypothetical protein n=1 Tax=Myxococcus xanthus TaxID=34 RepID=UPI001917099F|nr:hypothetical protein [Myxococcus xanthus]QQR46552.1 hypothetical protein JKA73_10985 [Myxococcus xanthus]